MRKPSLVFAGCAAFALSVSALAQDKPKVPSESEYSQLMKGIQTAQQAVRKSVDAKAPADAAADAARLHESFVQVEAFWKQRNVEDAVKAAGDAVAGAAKMVAASKSGNADDLSAGFAAVSAQCRTCHTAHRERNPDGSYRIK